VKLEKRSRTQFEEDASRHADSGVMGELWAFIRQNKKWWLLPIVVAMLFIGLLIFLSGTAAAPFIYTLF
jgi:hypothetical protein